MRVFFFLGTLFITLQLFSQTTSHYQISFENAVHHEAKIRLNLTNLNQEKVRLRMSRSSPGRYAVHEFAKNIYDVKAFDENGNRLNIERSSPQEWIVSGHNGSVQLSYTLFANHADGTYSQIDETHAHLNIPATFMYLPDYPERPIEVQIDLPEDRDWKVATQLKEQENGSYYAPNLQYFMDSPIEVSNHQVKSFVIANGENKSTIKFVLHQLDDYQYFDRYFQQVESVVKEQIKVFGALPDFDFGSYTFLACYAPQVDGDGMEHRNSTVLTSTRSLSKGGLKRNISTVAHEFFHAWNVERIRPASLEPFNFEDSNMSGELWFAEGFTSYYTNLSLCRAGIISQKTYVEDLGALLSRIVNSPGRNYFNPIEMSYQAPFVDAATSIDQVNRENTFISYYSYGNFLGLALDLSLRSMDAGKSLDGYMRLVWNTYGEKEIPYSIDDLQTTLAKYSDEKFAQDFFSNYIRKSEMPDFQSLFANFGISMAKAYPGSPDLGATVLIQGEKWLIASNPKEGSALYRAQMSKGDLIQSLDGIPTDGRAKVNDVIKKFKPGQKVMVSYLRYGKTEKTELIMDEKLALQTVLVQKSDKKAEQRRNEWLSAIKN